MFTNPRVLGAVALLIATGSWGGLFLVSKGVLHYVDPTWFTLIRYAIAGAALTMLPIPRGTAPCASCACTRCRSRCAAWPASAYSACCR